MWHGENVLHIPPSSCKIMGEKGHIIDFKIELTAMARPPFTMAAPAKVR